MAIQIRVAPKIVLTAGEHAELSRLVRSKLTSVRREQCARIVLLAADGPQNRDVAMQRGVGRAQVSRWRERYAQSGLSGRERDLSRDALFKPHRNAFTATHNGDKVWLPLRVNSNRGKRSALLPNWTAATRMRMSRAPISRRSMKWFH